MQMWIFLSFFSIFVDVGGASATSCTAVVVLVARAEYVFVLGTFTCFGYCAFLRWLLKHGQYLI